MPSPHTRVLLTLSLAALWPLHAAAQAPAAPPAIPGEPRPVEALVTQFCASCHGANLTGNAAPSLLDSVTNHGDDNETLLRGIRDGWPLTGMPAFGALISPEEQNALVAYIRRRSEDFRFGRIPAPLPPETGPRKSELHTFKVETIAEDLDTPWGIEFLPDGRILVTERPGRLRVIENGKLLPEGITGLPTFWARQDGGLLDVTIHPRYAENGWVYLAYSEAGPEANTSMTVVIRGRIRNGAWVDQQDIFRATPDLYWVNNSHFGSRFLWDKEGNLFFTIGDRGRPYYAQDLSVPQGKILRVRDDGSPAPNNPFLFVNGALSTIWSYGHRHVQGLAIHPVTGKLWTTEHGPRAGDELNRVEPGRNYGWPVISYGEQQIGETIHGKEWPGMEQPIEYWVPTIAPAAIEFYTGDRFPKWKNHLFLAALSHQEVRRYETDGDRIVHQEVLVRGEGRVRDVVTGPDGLIYIAFNSPGRIARLVPAEETAP